MCGRFTQHYTWAEVHAFLSVFGPPRNLQPHYNIAPTRTIDVIRLNQDGKRELVPMRWGLIPGWWKKSPKEMPAAFNARAESVASKPMFRNAWCWCTNQPDRVKMRCSAATSVLQVTEDHERHRVTPRIAPMITPASPRGDRIRPVRRSDRAQVVGLLSPARPSPPPSICQMRRG